MKPAVLVLGLVAWLCAARVVHAQPGDLPLLDARVGVGLIYSNTDPAAQPLTDAAWSEALSRGVNAYQLAMGWDELIAPDGSPNTTTLEAFLALLDQTNLQVFFTLKTIDTNQLRLPASMLDPTTPTQLRPGLSFDSPEVIAAFTTLLDAVVPLLVEHGCFAMSIGNEVDIWLASAPSQQFPFAVFAEWGRQHTHGIEPDLAVGVTLTRGALTQPDLALLMMSVSDAAIWAYYPVDGVVLDPSAIRPEFDAIEALAGDRPVILQEAGVPGAPADGSPSLIGATDELQKAWVRAVFREVRRREAFRFVSWLHLSDWPQATIDTFVQYYGSDDPAFVEYLSGLGLMTNQGVARPALQEFMKQIGIPIRPPLRAGERALP